MSEKITLLPSTVQVSAGLLRPFDLPPATDVIVIAGACMVESRNQITDIAHMVQAAGATAVRGGAYKPRTTATGLSNAVGATITHPSPEPFEWLAYAGQEAGIPTMTEVMGIAHLGLALEVGITGVWSGAANALNYVLLEAIGESGIVSLHKDSHGGTYPQFCGALDHVRAGRIRAGWSTHHLYAIERGTFPGPDNPTRGIPRIDWVAALSRSGELVIGDVSHSAGHPDYVLPFAQAYLGAGAIGLMVEVTLEEGTGAVDGARQGIGPKRLGELMTVINQCRT